jgi:hypothetical protein
VSGRHQYSTSGALSGGGEAPKRTARIRRMQHQPVKLQARVINQILRGHFNYYGLAGNARKLQTFLDFTWREWKHSLSKRSQKGWLTWEDFKALLDKHPLVRPRIRIRYSQLAAYARL